MPITEAQINNLEMKLDDLEQLLSQIRQLARYVKTVISLHDGTVVPLTNVQKNQILGKYDLLKAAVVAKWGEMP